MGDVKAVVRCRARPRAIPAGLRGRSVRPRRCGSCTRRRPDRPSRHAGRARRGRRRHLLIAAITCRHVDARGCALEQHRGAFAEHAVAAVEDQRRRSAARRSDPRAACRSSARARPRRPRRTPRRASPSMCRYALRTFRSCFASLCSHTPMRTLTTIARQGGRDHHPAIGGFGRADPPDRFPSDAQRDEHQRDARWRAPRRCRRGDSRTSSPGATACSRSRSRTS